MCDCSLLEARQAINIFRRTQENLHALIKSEINVH
jgi:hypothetical protein